MSGTNRGMNADAAGNHIEQRGSDDVPSLATPIRRGRLEITHRPFRTGFPTRPNSKDLPSQTLGFLVELHEATGLLA